MKSNRMTIGLVTALALTLVLVAIGRFVFQPYTFHGSVIEPPIPTTDFVLTAQTAQPFRLSEQRGNVVVMVFGYTSCPDVCPTTLAQFKHLRADLGTAAERVRFVFVTIDPERDTPEKLRTYMTAFDPTFIGLTGTNAELEPVWKQFGVYRAKREVGSAAGYLMDHSSRVYVIDARGNFRLTFVFETDRRDMLQDLRYLVNQGS